MIARELLEALREYDTPLLANTLDYIDDTPTAEWYMGGDIHGVIPDQGSTVGVAVTCKMDTSTPDSDPDMSLYLEQLAHIEGLEVPAVWVVEMVGPRPDHECTLGDGTAKMLHSVGCVGAITNGRVRDVAGLRTVPFPVFCRGTVVHHCALRVTAIDVPVSVGGITVDPGDIMHAFDEGVIKIPPAAAETVLEKAPVMRAAENETHHIFRRTDLSIAEKHKHMHEVFTRCGFIRKD
jgi:regulator of RNase E activity RraA